MVNHCSGLSFVGDELFLVKITFEILPLLTVTLTSLIHSSIQKQLALKLNE